MNPADSSHSQRIRSFVPRQGRRTLGQEFALENYWSEYGLDTHQKYDFVQVFGRDAPIIIEIGFGNGDSLAKMALANPENNYIGIEVHTPGVGHLLMQIKQHDISNLRIYRHDAIDILEQQIPDNSLTGVHLFFPDPWPKKRHHKRRIVRASFVDLLVKKLKPEGYFHAATDWQEYAKHILNVLSIEKALSNASATHDYCERPDYRPLTKFEQRGIRLGHGVWDLIFTKI
jgi:tRNA (guanine-N7-)-methyltransferase